MGAWDGRHGADEETLARPAPARVTAISMMAVPDSDESIDGDAGDDGFTGRRVGTWLATRWKPGHRRKHPAIGGGRLVDGEPVRIRGPLAAKASPVPDRQGKAPGRSSHAVGTAGRNQSMAEPERGRATTGTALTTTGRASRQREEPHDGNAPRKRVRPIGLLAKAHGRPIRRLTGRRNRPWDRIAHEKATLRRQRDPRAASSGRDIESCGRKRDPPPIHPFAGHEGSDDAVPIACTPCP
jgi:hypothetical protein